MIGQQRFKDYLSNWKLPPQFIILQGEAGSGRSTLIEEIKNKYKFNSIICGTSVDEVREIITLAYQLSSPTFYLFYNGDKLSNSAKNALLKIVEEPPKNAYFIMRTENSIIDTLRNRSFYYTMQSYTFKEIEEYFKSVNKQELFNQYGVLCKNIGQIKIFLDSDYEAIIKYCDTIVNVISEVAQGNIFNIPNKLNLGNDIEKWNITLFVNILEWSLSKKYRETKEDKYFQAIYRLNDLRRQLRITGVNKQAAFDNFLLGLKYLL